MQKPWWGTSWCTSAWAMLGYDWVYVPILNGIHIKPWSVTGYGLAMLIIGVSLLALQAALGLQPRRI